ncbi:MAG TPA: SCP2 sterol-binding domain-containing protein [Actinomycetota bacterium]
MATAEEVEQSLYVLMERLHASGAEAHTIPDRSIICFVPDLETAFWTELKGARFYGLTEVEPGTVADARITARSDDLIALIDGRLHVGFAFITGKIRIDASAADLMMIRHLL